MAGKKHLQPSKLVRYLSEEALCRCGKNGRALKPEVCPLHGVLPSDGDGMCQCCSTCRDKCFEEI